MKSTGLVRKIDELGRVVIPIELRRTFDLNEKDPVEIFVDEEQVILRKFTPNCIFCGEGGELKVLKGKSICKECLNELKGE